MYPMAHDTRISFNQGSGNKKNKNKDRSYSSDSNHYPKP